MILTGVLINAAAVAAGGVLGTLGGRFMPEKMKQTVLAATGLVSIGIGISGAIGSSNQLIPILSLVIGSVIGELLHMLASLLTGVLTDAVITEISVTGSLIIIGVGLNVLGLTKLRIMNMTPALLLPILLCRFM